MTTQEVFPGSSKLVKSSIPEGILLLVGPPGVGKTIFTRQFIWNGLREGKKVLCVLTDESPEMFKANMKSMGFNIEPYLKNRSLKQIDCYSKRFGFESSCKYSVDTLIDTSPLSIMIEKARGNWSDFRVVFDSISTLALEAGSTTGQKFLSILAARIRRSRGLGLFSLESGIHDEHFVNFLRFVFDGVLEMKISEETGELKRYFRIYSIRGAQHNTSWASFEITSKGIVI